MAKASINKKNNYKVGLEFAVKGYVFNDKYLLQQALTHSSFRRENQKYIDGKNVKDNERLEFLGDALLDLIIGDVLYQSMPDEKEGNLSKKRASIVCEKSLAKIAESINLGDNLILGHGEELSGGRSKPSMLADAMEALIGAIYIDSNYETAYKWVSNLFYSTVQQAIKGQLYHDYKSALQEKLQKHGSVNINYETYKEEGPPHMKIFYVRVFCDGKELGCGSGKSKKIAEQEAALNAIEKGI